VESADLENGIAAGYQGFAFEWSDGEDSTNEESSLLMKEFR